MIKALQLFQTEESSLGTELRCSLIHILSASKIPGPDFKELTLFNKNFVSPSRSEFAPLPYDSKAW